jgi:hypothetical protein
MGCYNWFSKRDVKNRHKNKRDVNKTVWVENWQKVQ